MDDIDFKDSSSEEEDEAMHENLLDSVYAMNKRRSHHYTRTEPSTRPSEYHLTRGEDEQVKVAELVNSLKEAKGFKSLKKRLRPIEEESGKVLPPLPKVETNKAQRKIAHSLAVKQVSKWIPTVKRNREAAHLYFNQLESKPPPKSIKTLVESHEPRTPLEKEIAELFAKTDHVVVDKEEGLTKAEKRALERMNVEEAKMRRQELQKIRTLMFHQEKKFKREKKIKSKRFHKIKRKKREKEAKSLLEKEGIKVEEVEQTLQLRAKERMTLKHSSRSKWAKRVLKTGMKNDELKKMLSESHQLGRELKEKVVATVSDQEESDEEEQYLEKLQEDPEDTPTNDDGGLLISTSKNPWLSSSDAGACEQPSERNEVADLKTTDNNNTKEKTKMESDKTHSKKPGAITIDAANFLMLNLETDNMTSSNQETDRIMTIKSAFANDDVVQEFLKEKEELVEGDKHVETDLTLPGWGSWAGEGVKQNKKRKRTVKKLKPEVKRKDSDLKYVIISEERDTKIAKHQVSTIPHPFKNRDQFEKAHCHPVGRQWNSESTFQQLIKPRVILPTGTIISPIEKPTASFRRSKRK